MNEKSILRRFYDDDFGEYQDLFEVRLDGDVADAGEAAAAAAAPVAAGAPLDAVEPARAAPGRFGSRSVESFRGGICSLILSNFFASSNEVIL